jgi:hypothetical protein
MGHRLYWLTLLWFLCFPAKIPIHSLHFIIHCHSVIRISDARLYDTFHDTYFYICPPVRSATAAGSYTSSGSRTKRHRKFVAARDRNELQSSGSVRENYVGIRTWATSTTKPHRSQSNATGNHTALLPPGWKSIFPNKLLLVAYLIDLDVHVSDTSKRFCGNLIALHWVRNCLSVYLVPR